jgi:riboflavin biosynthesis pyrimidine reductase
VVHFNRLAPTGSQVGAEELLASLGDAVALNMVTTIDGRAAIDGSSRALGGPGDLAMLIGLRAWAQVLVVGARTVRAEGYGKIRPDLLVVVVSRSGDIPWDAPLFAADGQPVETFTGDDAAPDRLIEALRERGYRRILLEGGPTLNRAMLAAGVVDQLFLTLTPRLVADDSQPRIVSGEPFPEPLRAELVWTLESGGELFLRYSFP